MHYWLVKTTKPLITNKVGINKIFLQTFQTSLITIHPFIAARSPRKDSRHCLSISLGHSRASRIRNLSTSFFVRLITCLRTRSRTSHFVHLKQSFVNECTAMCTLPCAYYKYRNILEQKVNVRSIPLTINPEPSMGIQTIFL